MAAFGRYRRYWISGLLIFFVCFYSYSVDTEEKKEILSGYTYDVVSSLKTHTNYYDITYKYVLLPVYVAQCSRKGKQYNIYVNGIDGKVAGKAPVSGVRVLVTVAVVFGILLLVGLLGA